MEQLMDRKTYRNRKQEVYDLIMNRETGKILELMNNIAKQAYIAGANRINICDNNSDKTFDKGDTGDLALLSQLFAKDKGLCQ